MLQKSTWKAFLSFLFSPSFAMMSFFHCGSKLQSECYHSEMHPRKRLKDFEGFHLHGTKIPLGLKTQQHTPISTKHHAKKYWHIVFLLIVVFFVYNSSHKDFQVVHFRPLLGFGFGAFLPFGFGLGAGETDWLCSESSFPGCSALFWPRPRPRGFFSFFSGFKMVLNEPQQLEM